MEVSRGRALSQSERTQLRRVMRAEDTIAAELDRVLARRDELLQSLRWGDESRAEVMPETLRAATVSVRHPHGLGRTTLHRAVGRKRDRPASTESSTQDDEQET